MKIVVLGILENISTRQDNSIKLVIGSQEMDDEMAGKLFSLRNKYLKMLLSDNNITPIEEALIDEQRLPDGKKAKSESQLLRNVLFRLHEYEGGNKDTFDVYYKDIMRKIIEHYKDKMQ